MRVYSDATDKHIVHDIYLKWRKDKRVIREIVASPILFARHKFADPDDWRPIRIRYFAAFVPKHGAVIKEK